MVDVESNLGLAGSCARRFLGKGIEYDDLYQIACEGLVKAAAGFDATRGIAFSSYAVPVILGEIKGAFRKSGAIKVSRRLKETAIMLRRAASEFEKNYGKSPTVCELASACGLEKETVAEALESTEIPLSLSEWSDDRGFEPEAEGGFDSLLDSLDMQRALEELEPCQKRLFELRYIYNRTQTEVAKIFGVSQVSVSRKEKQIRDLLHDKLICTI